MTKQSWDVLVGEMLIRRTRLEQTDPVVYRMPEFGTRATDADLAAVAARLGHPLDAQHAALLREVDGWPWVFAHGDLLSTADLGAGTRWEHARTMLTVYYEDGAALGFPPRGSVYPIHCAERDVFVVDMSGPTTDAGHPVYWLSEQARPLAVWPNVYEYWIAGFALLEQTQALTEERLRAGRGRG